ncbi:caspase-8-like isoform X2 [Littorina saxatilis]|uniref:caspase-8-like isoform X2 n=1 Tax=Littorina saxatilis TaxID=31220 RepID=UPI0038B44E10
MATICDQLNSEDFDIFLRSGIHDKYGGRPPRLNAGPSGSRNNAVAFCLRNTGLEKAFKTYTELSTTAGTKLFEEIDLYLEEKGGIDAPLPNELQLKIYMNYSPTSACTASMVAYTNYWEMKSIKASVQVIFAALYNVNRPSCRVYCEHGVCNYTTSCNNIKGLQILNSSENVKLRPFNDSDWADLAEEVHGFDFTGIGGERHTEDAKMRKDFWELMETDLPEHRANGCFPSLRKRSSEQTTSMPEEVRLDGSPRSSQQESTAVQSRPASYELCSYRMSGKPRGLCIIINNEKFKDRKKVREGSHIDRDKLRKTFKKMEFDVQWKDDLTSEGMLSLMKEISTKNHEAYDCFVCCVLTHGKEGELLGSDDKPVLVKELTEPLQASKCPSLADKPKLYFLQACQGHQHHGGNLASDEAHDRPTTDSGHSAAVTRSRLVADEVDFLMSYATVAGYVAYRHPKEGSPYVSALCDLLNKYSTRYDLQTILTMLNGEVSSGIYISTNSVPCTQVPCVMHTLTKRLEFRAFSESAANVPGPLNVPRKPQLPQM